MRYILLAILSLTIKIAFGQSPKEKDPTVIRVGTLPDPITYFGNYCGQQVISKTELNSIKAVLVKTADAEFNKKHHFVLVSYQLTVQTKTREIPFYDCKGNKISPEILELFKTVSRGDKIHFDNVKAKTPNGTIVVVPGLTLTVK